MPDPMMVAQGLGFIRRTIEFDIEDNRQGAEQALEWFTIIESACDSYRRRISELETLILNAKIALK